MILNTKRIHDYFWRNFPAFKSFICWHGHGLWFIARQIVIVGNSTQVTKTIIRLSVGGYSQVS